MSSERKYLGIVSVDSGTLLISDPAHVLPHAEGGETGVDYQAVIDATDPVTRLAGRPALLLQAFGGDGDFPVYGEYEDGEFMRIVIDLESPELGEDQE